MKGSMFQTSNMPLTVPTRRWSSSIWYKKVGLCLLLMVMSMRLSLVLMSMFTINTCLLLKQDTAKIVDDYCKRALVLSSMIVSLVLGSGLPIRTGATGGSASFFLFFFSSSSSSSPAGSSGGASSSSSSSSSEPFGFFSTTTTSSTSGCG